MLPEKSLEELEMDLMVDQSMLRRLEDIEYWRKRAGWYDDEVSMKEFNNGVYDTYYQLDDDEIILIKFVQNVIQRIVLGGRIWIDTDIDPMIRR